MILHVTARAVVLLCALATAAVVLAAGPVGWGGDINEGEGPKLIAEVRPALAAIVKASDAERGALIERFVADHGLRGIEATKRFRNPELRPLFHALLAHDDWKVKHRALFALEYYGDADDLAGAWSLLAAEPPRLREKAAIACIKLFDTKIARAAAGGDPVDAVRALWASEKDPHVRACLEALTLRARGKLTLQTAYTEYLRTDDDGLIWTPFLTGMTGLKDLAPGYSAKGLSQSGGSSAAKGGPSPVWTTPLLAYGDEEVKGTSLQPFANLRGGGKVYHLGQDVGACLEGAGYYAAAEGVVKFVHSGSDMGTLLVVQHCTHGKDTVNAIYMHGGGTVFVKGGDAVEAGQLIGTLGMGYSLENGGHFAHLHYGLYPGDFSATHNYGYRNVSAGLADWHDPAAFLAEWTERASPLLPSLPTFEARVPKSYSHAAKGAYGKAHAEASKVLASEKSDDDEKAAAGEFTALIEGLVPAVVERAKAQRARGFPSYAHVLLSDYAGSCKGVPGVDTLADLAKEWSGDAAFKRELEADQAIDATARKAAKLAGEPEKAKALWQKVLEEFGDTPLRARIEAAIARL